MSGETIRDACEFRLIEQLRYVLPEPVRASSDLITGIGDDTAVWRPSPGEDLLITTDAMIAVLLLVKARQLVHGGKQLGVAQLGAGREVGAGSVAEQVAVERGKAKAARRLLVAALEETEGGEQAEPEVAPIRDLFPERASLP